MMLCIDTGAEPSHFNLRSRVALSNSCTVCAAGDLVFIIFLRAATFSSYSSSVSSLFGKTNVGDSVALGRIIFCVLAAGVFLRLLRYR